jgi:hypothetical protein
VIPRALLCALLALATPVALAHGGGIDKCGGHKDKKRGGYHVHNKVKFCACNPQAADCKSADEPATAKKLKKTAKTDAR